MSKTKAEVVRTMQSFIRKGTGIYLLTACFCLPAFSQRLTQNIRGTVTDRASGAAIGYATIQLEDAPGKGAITDSVGNFLLAGIPIGRHTVKTTCVGYETSLVREVPAGGYRDSQP